jgi:hypothetical protein
MSDLTPQQLNQLLLNELSASAGQPLLDNDGTKFTLRGAVARILWKVNFMLPLKDRPVDPRKADDLYGHILSMRLEGLRTQALLAALCQQAKIDVGAVFAKVESSVNQ